MENDKELFWKSDIRFQQRWGYKDENGYAWIWTEEKLLFFYFLTVELENEMSEADESTGCSLQLLLAPVTLLVASGTGLYPRIFLRVFRNSFELGATNFRGPNAVKATPAMMPSVSWSKSKKTRRALIWHFDLKIYRQGLFHKSQSFADRFVPPTEFGRDLLQVFCTWARRPPALSVQDSLHVKHF